jgi:predicted CoA-binding protein
MKPQSERVVIVGASDKPDRYAFQAFTLLRDHGHEVVPVHPRLTEIEGVPVVSELSQVTGAVDTVTLYVGPAISSGLAETLIALHPRRVITNPGTENPALEAKLQAAGIDVQQACTLVLLRTGQF